MKYTLRCCSDFPAIHLITVKRPGSADEGSPAFRSSGIACGPARLPAGLLVRERQGCSLAVMAAVGIRIGSLDEGRPPGGRGRSSPAFRSRGIVGGPARLPVGPRVREAAGMQLGGEGGGRDSDWQRG
jgi:hypothetical protein